MIGWFEVQGKIVAQKSIVRVCMVFSPGAKVLCSNGGNNGVYVTEDFNCPTFTMSWSDLFRCNPLDNEAQELYEYAHLKVIEGK